MSFLNPLALWGPLALAAVALPILIHLLSRFRPKPMEWGAMELLRRALVVRARRVRLEDILLMILRGAALAAVAIALARPALMDSASSWVGNAQVGAVVAIDGSFSMGHQPGVSKSRFEQALVRAREALATLSPGDPMTLVLLGQRPRVVLRNVAFDRERVEAVLTSLEPLAEPLNVEGCVEELARLQADLTAPAKECFVITDAQATAWGNVSEATAGALAKLRRECAVYFVPVGFQNSENVAVTRFTLSSGVLRPGALARFQADVRNFGRLEARNLSAKLLIDGIESDKTLIDSLNPGETRSLSFFAAPKRAGALTVSASLEGSDPLAIDNQRNLIADVRDSVRVLCVDGSPSPDRLGGETGVLRLALTGQRAGGDDAAAAGPVRASVVPPDDLRAADLTGYDIVCLAGVGELSHAQVVGLSEFVNRGGGLIVFLGRKSDRNALNAMRGGDGTPLLPAELNDLVGEHPRDGDAAEAKAWNLSPDLVEHPVVDVLSRIPREQWTGVRFWRYAKAQPRDGAQVLLKMAPGNDPVLLEQRHGRGKVYLFTTSANRDWNDMLVSPTYLMILQQMVTDLTRQPYEKPVLVGEALTFAVAADDPRRELTIRNPTGEELQALIVEKNGHKSASLEHADRPGVYLARGTREQSFAVNVATDESNVAVLPDAELRQLTERNSLRLVTEKQPLRAAVMESRKGRELWRMLLIAALLLLTLEAVLARWFTRRAQSPVEVYTRRAAAI